MNIEQLYQLFVQYPHICTDTRNITPNSLFFALKGDNFDGNRFAIDALEKGCVWAVVDSAEFAKNERCIIVHNVIETLQQLAQYHRRQLNIPILAITGTNGKTTTKELIGRVLSQKFEIGITQGNLNNHIGVPLTLLSFNKHTNFGIVEMGANHIGEIAALCQIAQPNFGLITNVGKAHLEGFGSPEGVKQAKGELYDYVLQTAGKIFENTDDVVLSDMISKRDGLQVHPYSSTLSQVLLLPTDNQNPFLRFTINGSAQINTSLIGTYNLNNVLAAIAIGQYFEVDFNKIIEAIENYQPINNRSQLIRTATNTIYMDAYNANPSSMEVAIRNFSLLNEQHKLLILGDMLELGDTSLAEHQQLIEQIKNAGFTQVWLVGNIITKAAKHYPQFRTFNTVNELNEYMHANPVKNCTILIKGSRGIRLEKALEML